MNKVVEKFISTITEKHSKASSTTEELIEKLTVVRENYYNSSNFKDTQYYEDLISGMDSSIKLVRVLSSKEELKDKFIPNLHLMNAIKFVK